MKAFFWSLGNQLLTDELLEFRISWVCYLPNEIEKSILNAIRPFFGVGEVFSPSLTLEIEEEMWRTGIFHCH